MGGIAHSMTKMIGVDTGAVIWISVNAPLYHSSKCGVIITEVDGLHRTTDGLCTSLIRPCASSALRASETETVQFLCRTTHLLLFTLACVVFPKAPQRIPKHSPSLPKPPKLPQTGRAWIEQASPSLPKPPGSIPQAFPKPSPSLPPSRSI